MSTVVGRQGGGELEKTLSAYKVGLEVRTERIAAPRDAGNFIAGSAEERVIQNSAKGSALRDLLGGEPRLN